MRLPCWSGLWGETPWRERAMPAIAQLFPLFQAETWVKTPTWRTLQPQQIQRVKNQETQPIAELRPQTSDPHWAVPDISSCSNYPGRGWGSRHCEAKIIYLCYALPGFLTHKMVSIIHNYCFTLVSLGVCCYTAVNNQTPGNLPAGSHWLAVFLCQSLLSSPLHIATPAF